MNCNKNCKQTMWNRRAWLKFVAVAVCICSIRIGQADENERCFPDIRSLDAFVQETKNNGVAPMAIPSFAQAADETAQAKREWGQAMLEDLERLWRGSEREGVRNVEMTLDFRDWCLDAPGGGNLQLAIASEETAVELLFRGLASGILPPEEIQRLLVRCSGNAPTETYWRDTLSLEGHPSAKATSSHENDAEYLKLAAVFNDIWQNGFVGPIGATRPDDSGWWGGHVGDFFAPQLMIRVLDLSKKSVALEACLETQRKTGDIPQEWTEFKQVLETNAGGILEKRERLTSWLSTNDAWKYWSKARDAGSRRP